MTEKTMTHKDPVSPSAGCARPGMAVTWPQVFPLRVSASPRLRVLVLCVLCGSILLPLGGCSKKHNYDPQANGGPRFPNDKLGVMVDAPHNATADQPKITNVQFKVDGQEAAIPNNIALSTEKTGHCEYISFTAPRGASAIQLDLTILHDRKIYKMTVPFQKGDQPGVAWKRANATVVLEGKAQ